MRTIHNIHDIEAVLARVAAQTTKEMLAGMTLDRILRLAAVAGSPHERLRAVHVAGTSGKTSTSYMTAHLLRRASKRVGLTVSPSVVSIREWVQLSDTLMSEEEFVRYFAEFQSLVEDIGFTPTRFEYMMVFALWVFDRAGVDYAVIETGLGGLRDASNICQRTDKLCVITDIGLDHVTILGNTLEEIAAQKAGIVAPENTAVMYEQGSEVMTVFRKAAAAKGAELIEIQPHSSDLFMQRNARLSLEAYRAIARRDGLPVLGSSALIDELAHLTVPGRLQFMSYRDKQVLLDGAHNQQKMAALVAALKALHPDKRWSAVFAMKADKDYQAAIAEIAPLLERVIAVPLGVGGDMPLECIAPEELQAQFRQYGIMTTTAVSGEEGLNALIDKGCDNSIVTGSLYAVAEVMRSIQ